jgi:hypothetical protein
LPKIAEETSIRRWVRGQNPNVVFGYGFEKDRGFWSQWDTAGLSWVPMATAGDVVRYHPNLQKTQDLVYLGGYWKYKSGNLDAYLIPVIRELGGIVRGWGDWPLPNFGGSLDAAAAPSFLAAGKVGPCVAEPHTVAFGIDIPERVWKLALSGTAPVHDPVLGIKSVFPELWVAKNPIDYLRLLKVLLQDDERRLAYAKAAYSRVVTQHTYHHRLAGLLNRLGFTEQAQTLLRRLADYQWPQ